MKKCCNAAFSDKIQVETCPSILYKNSQKVNRFSGRSASLRCTLQPAYRCDERIPGRIEPYKTP